MGLLVLGFCASFCQERFYPYGFEIPSDKTSCFCGERVPKSTPSALVLTLFWNPRVDKEDRHAIVSTPEKKPYDE